MKKYLLFLFSFILLFLLFQVVTGLILTFAYTPDIEGAWNRSAILPKETSIVTDQVSFLVPLVPAFLAASIAYFIPKLFLKNRRSS
ncbi:hypothetical protein [Oceanobacillus kapialis]|uniref:Uncharacterized protein n=1 Tax=Oceanobacillus kapialis TaxID=481353 RepID=A0ABW5Q1N1_9BACI